MLSSSPRSLPYQLANPAQDASMNCSSSLDHSPSTDGWRERASKHRSKGDRQTRRRSPASAKDSTMSASCILDILHQGSTKLEDREKLEGCSDVRLEEFLKRKNHFKNPAEQVQRKKNYMDNSSVMRDMDISDDESDDASLQPTPSELDLLDYARTVLGESEAGNTGTATTRRTTTSSRRSSLRPYCQSREPLVDMSMSDSEDEWQERQVKWSLESSTINAPSALDRIINEVGVGLDHPDYWINMVTRWASQEES